VCQVTAITAVSCACRARNTEWAAFPRARGPGPNLAERPVPATQAGLVRRVCQWAGGSGSRNQGQAQLGPESRRLNGPMAAATGLLGRPFEPACCECIKVPQPRVLPASSSFESAPEDPFRTSSVRRERGELASLDALPHSKMEWIRTRVRFHRPPIADALVLVPSAVRQRCVAEPLQVSITQKICHNSCRVDLFGM
jgi:hypothetical protein